MAREPGIYGSKPTESEGVARGQGRFTLPPVRARARHSTAQSKVIEVVQLRSIMNQSITVTPPRDCTMYHRLLAMHI